MACPLMWTEASDSESLSLSKWLAHMGSKCAIDGSPLLKPGKYLSVVGVVSMFLFVS
eukprot:CAMPEP_0197249168 /NCGR_PEP_ID=MMETSP1429-20130617/45463_1 /TAXON_ID=49237 /ORGANISM="Chaetoceros  sp., Strain UNC1202" /LENGTH=56 /DNA_ID=CAMNT_0042710615 /DNA_START=133 /DNA_END=299 /DNA_ORIENTATION=-